MLHDLRILHEIPSVPPKSERSWSRCFGMICLFKPLNYKVVESEGGKEKRQQWRFSFVAREILTNVENFVSLLWRDDFDWSEAFPVSRTHLRDREKTASTQVWPIKRFALHRQGKNSSQEPIWKELIFFFQTAQESREGECAIKHFSRKCVSPQLLTLKVLKFFWKDPFLLFSSRPHNDQWRLREENEERSRHKIFSRSFSLPSFSVASQVEPAR